MDILFNYNMPTDDYKLEVIAFKVRVKDSVLEIIELSNLIIRIFVNSMVDVYKPYSVSAHIYQHN